MSLCSQLPKDTQPNALGSHKSSISLPATHTKVLGTAGHVLSWWRHQQGQSPGPSQLLRRSEPFVLLSSCPTSLGPDEPAHSCVPRPYSPLCLLAVWEHFEGSKGQSIVPGAVWLLETPESDLRTQLRVLVSLSELIYSYPHRLRMGLRRSCLGCVVSWITKA